MAAHPSILPGESRGQRSLEGYSPRGPKEENMTERLTLKTSDGLYGGSAGLKGKRALLPKFLFNRERCCFSVGWENKYKPKQTAQR